MRRMTGLLVIVVSMAMNVACNKKDSSSRSPEIPDYRRSEVKPGPVESSLEASQKRSVQALERSHTQAGGEHESVNHLRGFLTVNALLVERFLEDDQIRFDLGRYLDSAERHAGYDDVDETSDLRGLLGAEYGEGLRSGIRNGKPNALNMVLWHLVLERFAGDVAFYCRADTGGEEPPLAVNRRLQNILPDLCAWPSVHPESRRITALKALWDLALVADAPSQEWEAYREFFMQEGASVGTGEEAVRMMVLAALYNPHFLLRK